MSWLSLNPHLALDLALARHRHLIRAAALSLALAGTRDDRPGLLDRGLERLADALIAVGSRLKRRRQRHVVDARPFVSVAR